MRHLLLATALPVVLAGGLSAQQYLAPLAPGTSVTQLTPGVQVNAVPSVRATTGCDDFNRTTGLGLDWVSLMGTPGILNDAFTCNNTFSRAQYVPASVNYDAATVTIDLPDDPQIIKAGAILLGLGGAENLYVELQCTTPGTGIYDAILFFTGMGFNTSATTGWGGAFGLVTPVTGGTLTIYVDPLSAGDTLMVEIDVDRDGNPEQTFAAPNSTLTGNGSLLSSFGASAFGTGIGVGGVSVGSATEDLDDFELNGGCTVTPTGPQVAVASGAPGGQMSFDFTGFEPGGRLAVAYGLAGVLPIPSGPCAGLTLDLVPLNYPPVSALLLLVADGSGAASLTTNVGAVAAGVIRVQAADIDNATGCALSNTLVL